MARILSISSQVVSGHVGNSAITFALQRLGHEVLALPTILLSNHPGHKIFAGSPIDPGLLNNILTALETNGQLKNLDAILTGYLPDRQHVEFACTAIEKVKSASSDTLILVDPVIGDTPKGLYIDLSTAEAVKQDLLPKANLTTPNFFELQWLTDLDADNLDQIIKHTRNLPTETALITSTPGNTKDTLNNLLVTDSGAWCCEINRYRKTPNGTGDLIAALFLEAILDGLDAIQAVSIATAKIDAVLQASIEKQELQLIETQHLWTKQLIWPISQIS